MPAELIHLVRHGEVYNPDRVLYERLPGFRLSETAAAWRAPRPSTSGASSVR